MMKHALILLLICCGLADSLHAVLSQDELSKLQQPLQNVDAIYSKTKTSLDALKAGIMSFPPSYQSSLLPQVQAVQANIKAMYTAALQKLQAVTLQAETLIDSKSGGARTIAVIMQVSELNEIASPVERSMQIDFSKINVTVSSAAQQLGLTQALNKAKQDQQQQAVYHQRVVALLQALSPIIDSFAQQNTRIRAAAVKQVQSGAADVDTIADITTASFSLMQQASQAYVAHAFPVMPTDSSNYVTAAFNQLTSYFLDEMAITVAQIANLFSSPTKRASAFFPLAQLGLRILGTKNSALSDAIGRLPSFLTNAENTVFTQGYNATAESLATTYFGDEALAMLHHYRNTKQRVTFDIFVNALQQITNSYPEPTDEQVGYAIIFYAVIVDDFDVLATELTTRWQSQVAGSLAVFFASRAQAVLKKMQPGKNNLSLLEDAIDSYTQASDYYVRAGSTQDKALGQTYGLLATSLATAQKENLQAAQVATKNPAEAISLYQQAELNFKKAGDAVDGAQAFFALQTLLAAQQLQQGQQVLQDYINTSKSSFIQYMTGISASGGQVMSDFDLYAFLFTNLQSACQSALANYKASQAAFTTLSTLQIGQVQSAQNAAAQVAILNNSILWLQSLTAGLSSLSDANNQLRQIEGESTTDGKLASISAAASLYSNAIIAFKQVDTLNQTYPQIAQATIVLPSVIAQGDSSLQSALERNQAWTWSTVVARHIAAFYVATATQVATDIIVDMQCYSNAYAQNALLSPGMTSFLASTLQKLKSQKSVVDQLFKQAQQVQQQAMAAVPQDWQADDPTSQIYTSNANSLWQTALRTYANAYNLGNTQAKDAFIAAVVAYAKAYSAAPIPAQYYPQLGQALIEYNNYVFYSSLQDSQDAAEVLSGIKPLIETFFANGNALQQSIASVVGKSTVTLDAVLAAAAQQEQFIAWQARIEHALLQQQTIRGTIVPQDESGSLYLMSKVVDQQHGSTTYTSTLASTSIIVTNPIITLAQLHAQIGAIAYAQKSYVTAYNGYSKAKTLYESQGKSADSAALSTQYTLCLTLATAQQFRDSVIPNHQDTHALPSITIGGISIPQSYMLKSYEQIYPLPLPVGFDALAQATTATEKQQLQNQLQGMAVMLFLYNILKYQGFALRDVIDMGTMTPKPGISPEDLAIVATAVAQAKTFQSDLQTRITNKISSLYVVKKNGTYYVGEVYKPIPAIAPTDVQGDSTLPYITYPYATYYYLGAYDLFKPSADDINIGGNLYVPGNDTQSAEEMLALMANAYLSAGASAHSSLVSPASDISKALIPLKAINPNDMSVNLSDFMNTYNLVKNYYNNLVLLQYNTAYIYYGQYLQNQQYAAQLATLLGDIYSQFAQTLATFLIGDPLGSDYATVVLPDIEQYYKTAANYYNNAQKTKLIYEQIGTFYTNAGQRMVQEGSFIQALGALYRAEKTYRDIPEPDAAVQKLIENATLLKIKTMFKGSTQQLESYATKRFAGKIYPGTQQERPLIALTLSTGQKVEETFAELQQKYQMAGTNDIDQTGIDSVELQEYADIKATILDGLLFYSACSSAASKELPAGLKPSDPLSIAGLDLINTYSRQKNISFSSFDDITGLLENEAFSELVNTFFDQCAQKILTASALHDKLVGYSAIMQWANLLYFAYARVYMYDYLGGGVGQQQWEDFSDALQAQIQQIEAPSSLYT